MVEIEFSIISVYFITSKHSDIFALFWCHVRVIGRIREKNVFLIFIYENFFFLIFIYGVCLFALLSHILSIIYDARTLKPKVYLYLVYQFLRNRVQNRGYFF